MRAILWAVNFSKHRQVMYLRVRHLSEVSHVGIPGIRNAHKRARLVLAFSPIPGFEAHLTPELLSVGPVYWDTGRLGASFGMAVMTSKPRVRVPSCFFLLFCPSNHLLQVPCAILSLCFFPKLPLKGCVFVFLTHVPSKLV